jgi:hypothetical protein
MSNSQWNDDQGIGERAMRKWEKERAAARLREGEECHVARPGEGTYECRHDNPCAACRLRSAEARANRTTYTVGETEWAHRIAVAEQRFVEEYDAHQETRTLLTDLYMKQLRADAAQMREYGISYRGLRSLLAEYDGGELSISRVLELLRAAARELAKEEIAELKARIVTLEAAR